MEFEDELTELFDQATATLLPPVEELLEQSTAEGRRLRRRRRTARAAMGTFGVTAVVCGTAVGVLHGYAPARSAASADGRGGASPSGWAQPKNTVTPSASLATTVAAAASASVSGGLNQSTSSTPSQTPSSGQGGTSTDYDLLKSLLPAGANLEPMPYDWGGTVPGAADAVYNDGHGAVQLTVSTTSRSIMHTCAGWIGGTNEGVRPAGATPVSCATVTLPGGDVQTTVVTGSDASGFYDYEVSLTRTDGTNVMAVVGVGVPEGATVDVTRLVPPLTLAQLQVIAENPGWRLD